MEKPDYAPLPERLWQHVKSKRVWSTTPQRMDSEVLEALQQKLAEASAVLERDLIAAREQAFEMLNPFVRSGVLTRPNLLGLLNQHSPQPLNPATLTRWRQRNLLRYKQYQLDPHSAAAILIARLLLPDEKYGWLPSEIPDGSRAGGCGEDKLLWLCWM